MSDIQPTEAEREEAQRLLEHIYSLHGFISQKDRMTRQLSKLELNARRKEREDALIEIILAYRAEAMKAERTKEAAAFRAAVNAIYFDDSSDYKSALYEVIEALKPGYEPERMPFLETDEEATAILTAEPEPCESAQHCAAKVFESIHAENGDAMVVHHSWFTIRNRKAVAEVIDAYATRREQEAREDERRRWEETEKHGMIFIDATPDSGYILRILQAYIDNSYYSDNTSGIPPENPMVIMMNETREKRNELLRSAIAILQGTEPAKVSEDVERDIATVNETLGLFPGAGETRDAFARLVSRLKEGNSG